MMNSIFKHGGGGASGVMDYMLKEKDKRTPREGATVLRGDVEIQAKLIDSLVPKFKQQYVAGCWSFEESPEQVTTEQKNEIMDGTEELILAGLDPDRVSITWIEHTDKGRLELNYIVACVDLEHGRLFQPYMHSHDQARWNAFKDIQNITHGFTDPNDPAKARTMSQTDNLPRTTKELKEDITAELESQVIAGLINNRDEVKQAFNELGYTITRSSKDSISIKNPDPKGRNIKFKSTNKGGLYDINFNASAEAASEIERASADFRASASKRLRAAQAVYDKELERKRGYHQERHGQPKLNGREPEPVAKSAIAADAKRDRSNLAPVPSPFSRPTQRAAAERKRANDESRADDARYDARPQRERDHDHKRTSQAVPNNSPNSSGYRIDFGYLIWTRYSKNIKLNEVTNEQRAIRSSSASDASAARHDQASELDHRAARARDRDQRASYSSINSIIESISKSSRAGAASVADPIRELKKLTGRNSNRISKLGESAKITSESASRTSDRASKSREQTARTDESINELSARHTELRSLRDRYDQARERVEQVSEITISNQQLSKSLDDYAERNRISNSKGQQVARWATEQIAANKPDPKPTPEPTYRSPRP